jgi:large subunit ribosomal protein L32
MALPKRKHSKSRRDRRRGANSKIAAPTNLSTCPQCDKKKLPHRVCPHCGYYKGKPVVVVETVEKKKK